MNKDYTHIVVLLDRSGSMDDIRDDTIGGFNTFLKQQQEETGSATLTFVQFDSQDPYEVIHRFRAVKTVQALTRENYTPRAQTPLLDAMGRAISDLEESLAAIEPEGRPGQVLVAIVTDGMENASTEYTRDSILRMVERKKKEGWTFVFLSADLDAIGEAHHLGIDRAATMLFEKTGGGSLRAWRKISKDASDARKHGGNKH